jgi:putative ABC transport system permease protein
MHSLFQDVRFEFRQLIRKPGFTVVAVLTLALGAGANALMFTVIDSVLLRPLPYPDSRRLVAITSVQAGVERASFSLPNFLDIRAQSQSFSAMAAYHQKSVSLRLPSGEPVHSAGVAVSTSLFDVLQVRPMLGRSFAPGEDQIGRTCSVLLNAQFWREHLSGDAHVLGRNLTIDGQVCTISGVMPDGFAFPSHDGEFWVPLQPAPGIVHRGSNFLDVIARLKPTTTLAAAQTGLKVIAKRI